LRVRFSKILLLRSGFLKRDHRPLLGATERFSGGHEHRPSLEILTDGHLLKTKLGIFTDEQGVTSVGGLWKGAKISLSHNDFSLLSQELPWIGFNFDASSNGKFLQQVRIILPWATQLCNKKTYRYAIDTKWLKSNCDHDVRSQTLWSIWNWIKTWALVASIFRL